MAQRITPSTKIKVVPRDGELEITLNINITVDGQVIASANNAEVVSVQQVKEEEDHVDALVPDFTSSGFFGLFGKKSK
jgi:hypothetical protein